MRTVLCLGFLGAAAAFSPAMPGAVANRAAVKPLSALRMEQGASPMNEDRRRTLQVRRFPAPGRPPCLLPWP